MAKGHLERPRFWWGTPPKPLPPPPARAWTPQVPSWSQPPERLRQQWPDGSRQSRSPPRGPGTTPPPPKAALMLAPALSPSGPLAAMAVALVSSPPATPARTSCPSFESSMPKGASGNAGTSEWRLEHSCDTPPWAWLPCARWARGVRGRTSSRSSYDASWWCIGPQKTCRSKRLSGQPSDNKSKSLAINHTWCTDNTKGSSSGLRSGCR
mmetsp:Transcript_26479/g.76495  ORF Transcript_26479/g.76495 Transcript_26479/m.76495 type:complete len:210 (+) Transcript_26479:510-1139(+)